MATLVDDRNFTSINVKKHANVIGGLIADRDDAISAFAGRSHLGAVYPDVDGIIVLRKSQEDEVMYRDYLPDTAW